MDDKISVFESHITHLKNRVTDNVEQYQRKLCHRINGIDSQQEDQKEAASAEPGGLEKFVCPTRRKLNTEEED